MKSNYYGLRGVKLNIAIAVVAGTDFALFGYDQVRFCCCLCRTLHCADTIAGRLRRTPYIAYLPETIS